MTDPIVGATLELVEAFERSDIAAVETLTRPWAC